MKRRGIFALILLLFKVACKPALPPASRVFVIQPFIGIPSLQVKAIYENLRKINPKTILSPAIPLSIAAFYSQRNRYRADSIINYLNQFASTDTVIIALTNKDIGTTKGNRTDWGIMGLGFQPGNACVVSTFRLQKGELSDQLFKLSLHELAHTQGLPHCKNKTCFMRDAEGGNHLDEETGFCQSCKSFLKSKGWLLK
jgi:archaemetzincin